MGTPALANHCNGSDLAATPATPKSKELGIASRNTTQEPPHVVCDADLETPYARFGVSGVSITQNMNQRNGSGGVSGGVPGHPSGVSTSKDLIPGLDDQSPPPIGSAWDL